MEDGTDIACLIYHFTAWDCFVAYTAKVNPLLLHLSMLKGVQIIQMKLNCTHNLSPTIENSEVKWVNFIEKEKGNPKK